MIEENRFKGAYQGSHVVHEAFGIKLKTDLRKEISILRSGNIFEALQNFGDDSKVAILGLGARGNLAIRLSKAMGHKVLALSSKKSKQ